METAEQQNIVSPPKENVDANKQTPRRSARKSVMPLQDYDQIVNQKRVLRSAGKDIKSVRVIEIEESVQKARWTPAKVGRVSEKRGRRRGVKQPMMEVNKSKVVNDAELLDMGLEMLVEETKPVAEENKYGDLVVVETLAINDTFNESDCVIVSPNAKDAIEESSNERKDDKINSQISHELPPSNIPIIIVTDTADIEEQANTKEEKDDEMESLQFSHEDLCTSPAKVEVVVATENLDQHKNEDCLIVNDITSLANTEPVSPLSSKYDVEENPQLSATMPLVSMEPVEIVLRSIRKRSLSLCVGEANETRKERRNVTFHSPANQTTVIEDLDIMIAESVKKTTKKIEASGGSNKDMNVTQRRKRSLSFSDATIFASKPIIRKDTPKKPERTPIKGASISGAIAAKRTKLPNFAAIHEKQFNKMENLVEHMARKAERARTISSASKIYPLQRTTPSKDLQQKSTPSKNLLNQSHMKKDREKTKAVKQIVWTSPKSVNTNTPNRKKLAIIKPIPVNSSANTASTTHNSHLPVRTNVRSNKMTVLKSNTQDISNKKEQPKTTKYIFSASTSSTQASNHSIVPSSLTLVKQHEDKLAARRQRHMDMFKGRSDATATRKTDNILRGVRSNRRFELQMKHRRDMEQK